MIAVVELKPISALFHLVHQHETTIPIEAFGRVPNGTRIPRSGSGPRKGMIGILNAMSRHGGHCGL